MNDQLPATTAPFATTEDLAATQLAASNQSPPAGRRLGLRLVLGVLTFFVGAIYLFMAIGFFASGETGPAPRPGDPASNQAQVGEPQDLGFGNVLVPVSVTNPSGTTTYDYSVLVIPLGQASPGDGESWTVEFDAVGPRETARAEVVFTEPLPDEVQFAVVDATRNESWDQ